MALQLILASKSPRRTALLKAAHIPFTQLTVDTTEDYPPEMDVLEIPKHIAANKARAVAALSSPNATILAADTIVTIDQQVLGKPDSEAQAVAYLQKLSGNTHQVITGVCLLHQEQLITFSVTTSVSFHPLTLEQIQYYVQQFKPYDKAGAYGIQEWIGMVGIKAIDGDYYNVMGLPISRVIQQLQLLDKTTLPFKTA